MKNLDGSLILELFLVENDYLWFNPAERDGSKLTCIINARLEELDRM